MAGTDLLSGALEALARGASSVVDFPMNNLLMPAEDRTGIDDWERTYNYRWSYYVGFGLYGEIAKRLYEDDRWGRAIKNLRNPAEDTVEFYVTHVWPGDLQTSFPIEAKSTAHVDAIKRIWKWSNWNQRKDMWVRRTAAMGDGFLQAAMNSTGQRPYIQVIQPTSVTDFDTDERGFVTFIRLTDRVVSARTGKDVIRTEVWQKGTSRQPGTLRVWESDRKEEKLSRLGTPLETHDVLLEFGIDFVPFVWCPFKDIGEKRGMNAYFGSVKDEIDEINAQVTRLHQLIFRWNKATTAVLAGGFDTNGMPLPTPGFMNRNGSTPSNNTITMGDDDIIEFPGASSMEFLVPNIDWGAHLNAIEAQQASISKKLPEINYYLSHDKELSGRALRTLLGPAIARVQRVRTGMEDALARIDMQCMTLGAVQGVPGFENLGSFENDDLQHRFPERDVIPLSKEEQADTDKAKAETAILLLQAGVSPSTVIEYLGFDPIKEARLREATGADLAESMLAAFEKGQ
jgi:hypothetical protein